MAIFLGRIGPPQRVIDLEYLDMGFSLLKNLSKKKSILYA